MTNAIMLIANLLIAFAPGLPAQNPAPLKTFDATGQVIFKDKSQKVEGVEIVFERVSPQGLKPGSVRIDANGQWRQSGFQDGVTYRAIPRKQGFVFVPTNREFRAGTIVSLSFEASPSAGTQTKPSAKADPTEAPANTLTVSFAASGRVTTADGRGVPGVKIGFTLVSGKGLTPGEVETDAGGRWRQVGFSRGGVYQIMLRRLPGDSFNTAKNDILRFPAGIINVSNKDFQISIPKVVASGKVRTRTRGTGLGNVIITFSVESGAGQVPVAITTNALGEWSQQFEIGAQYKATPGKGGFQFTPGSITLSLLGAGGAQPSGLIRNLDFTVPDVFDVGGVITASDSRDEGAEVTLEIRAVGGQSELICHKTRIGLPWSKQLETGKTYQIEPRKSHSFDGKIYVFTPNSTRVDGPKRNVNFSGRGDPNIVQQTRFAQSCP